MHTGAELAQAFEAIGSWWVAADVAQEWRAGLSHRSEAKAGRIEGIGASLSICLSICLTIYADGISCGVLGS